MQSRVKLKRILLSPIRCIYYAQIKLILASWHYPGATFHKAPHVLRTTLRLRLLYKSQHGILSNGLFSSFSPLSLLIRLQCLLLIHLLIRWKKKKKTDNLKGTERKIEQNNGAQVNHLSSGCFTSRQRALQARVPRMAS